MSDIKEFNLIDVRNNSSIVNDLNNVYKLWGYEEISPSFINDLETIKGREVIDGDELIGIVSNSSLCLRPEMTTSIVKLTSTRLLNKKRPIRLFNSGIVFNKKQSYKNNRMIEYPSWEEQQDMQYWDAVNGTTTWKDKIAAIKTKYPKPS